MDRPVSPVSILDPALMTGESGEYEHDTGHIIESARIGFEYIQRKLNKSRITPGDGILLFLNYDVHANGDDDALIPLFCAATLLLRSARAGLDAIDPEYYSKLMTYMTNMLDEKSEEAARETGREGIN